MKKAIFLLVAAYTVYLVVTTSAAAKEVVRINNRSNAAMQAAMAGN